MYSKPIVNIHERFRAEMLRWTQSGIDTWNDGNIYIIPLMVSHIKLEIAEEDSTK